VFETSVFDGVYVTKDVDEAYFQRLHQARNDKAKANGSEEKEEDEGPASRKRKLTLGRSSSNDVTNGMLMSVGSNN